MLVGHEVALALDLRTDGDHECAAFAKMAVEVAPGLELRYAVGAPAAAEEINDQRTKGEQVARAHEFAAGVLQCEFRGLRAYRKDSLLDAGGKEFFDGSFADGETLRLHEVARVGVISSSWSWRGVMACSWMQLYRRFQKQPQILRLAALAQDDKLKGKTKADPSLRLPHRLSSAGGPKLLRSG